MATNTFEVYYLGVLADIDPDESDFASEDASDLVGLTVGTASDPFSHNTTLLTADDTTGDGWVESNDTGTTPENIIYDGTASGLDSTVEYWVTITYVDGSTASTEMMVIQDESGRAFLSPLQQGDSQNDPLNDAGIESITLDSVSWDDAESMYLDPESDAFIVCFAGGTLIETQTGPVDVSRLSVGAKVRTLDNGFQPLRWIGGRRVRAVGKLAPVRIRAGALGSGMPLRDLLVSRQHRVLVRSKIAQRVFGHREVLVAAGKLIGLPGIAVDPTQPRVTYWHFLFDQHQIVFSEGAATESLYPGPQALRALGPEARGEILALFPGIAAIECDQKSIRPLGQGGASKAMVVRHMKNQKPVFQVDLRRPEAAPRRAQCPSR